MAASQESPAKNVRAQGRSHKALMPAETPRVISIVESRQIAVQRIVGSLSAVARGTGRGPPASPGGNRGSLTAGGPIRRRYNDPQRYARIRRSRSFGPPTSSRGKLHPPTLRQIPSRRVWTPQASSRDRSSARGRRKPSLGIRYFAYGLTKGRIVVAIASSDLSGSGELEVSRP